MSDKPQKQAINMPTRTAVSMQESEPAAWIAECMECPFDECFNCRYDRYNLKPMIGKLTGCVDAEIFLREYNSGASFGNIARACGVPTMFMQRLLEVMGLPYKLHIRRQRPTITKETLRNMHQRVRNLFGRL